MSVTINTLEFYSGIGACIHACLSNAGGVTASTGGLHRALRLSKVSAQVVQAFDWDQNACRVYEENYGHGIVKKVRQHIYR